MTTDLKALRLPFYRSHKIVKAARIVGFELPRVTIDFNAVPEDTDPFPTSDLVRMTVELDASVFARGNPRIGDYLVIYDDGYASFSPAAAFEGGYSLLCE